MARSWRQDHRRSPGGASDPPSGSSTGSTAPVARASWAVFGVFAVNGFVFASWVSRLPATRDALGLTPAQIGLVLLIGAAGSLVALPLTGSVVQRFGTARTTRGSAAMAAAGFSGVALAVSAGSAPLVTGALVLAAMGIGAWDVSMNLQGAVVEHRLGRAIMPRFHAGFSLGAVAGAAVGALAAHLGTPVAWHLILAVAGSLAATLALTSAYLADGAVQATSGAERSDRVDALAAWREPRTVLIGLMVLASALAEGSANDWLALAVVDGFGAENALGALAFGVFVAAMTAMRLAGTRFLDRSGRVLALRISAATALAGLLLFGLSPGLPLAFLGVAAWGLGAALGFPVGMSAASDEPTHAAARVSVVSTVGYLAFLAGPPLLGLLADQVGYRAALLAVAGPLLISLVLAPVAAPVRSARHGGRRVPGARLG